MSCQEFEFVSVELARGSLLDAAARESALTHARGCASCAAHLRRQRALTSALREVSASMSELETPARVEAALLASMRERRGVGGATRSAHSETTDASRAPVVPLNAHSFRRALYAGAIAASLLLVALVSWLAFGHQTVTSSTGEIAGNAQGSNNATTYEASTTNKEVAEGSRVAAAVVTPTTAVRGSASGGRASKDGVGFVAASTGSTRREAKGSRSSLRPRVSEASETLPISFSVDGGSVIAPPLPPSQTGETASTDFVPLGPAGVSAPLDSGQMVRVEVPRAALAALGLPVNVARANETVKADVLLAHDGTARAIRLVQ